ncbi:hypothetical protein EYF80_035507 [Liparis tanakae]|uniref:Uncharacterized protein n=1 Tax=Liparis tanakae TaxID=230148 RepID=A0A4Z2GLS3_9TELE|nr:hypothetical protein EYF80_035507 [Liparis tanakae]
MLPLMPTHTYLHGVSVPIDGVLRTWMELRAAPVKLSDSHRALVHVLLERRGQPDSASTGRRHKGAVTGPVSRMLRAERRQSCKTKSTDRGGHSSLN